MKKLKLMMMTLMMCLLMVSCNNGTFNYSVVDDKDALTKVVQVYYHTEYVKILDNSDITIDEQEYIKRCLNTYYDLISAYHDTEVMYVNRGDGTNYEKAKLKTNEAQEHDLKDFLNNLHKKYSKQNLKPSN